MDVYICADLQAVIMAGSPVRYGAPNPHEPAVHDLPPLRYGADVIAVQLEVRRAEDGIWRGRLMFGESGVATADIFCAQSETDLWEAVQGLRDHHLRDLYRSVGE